MFCFDVYSMTSNPTFEAFSPQSFMFTEKLEIANFERRKIDEDQIFDLQIILQKCLSSLHSRK